MQFIQVPKIPIGGNKRRMPDLPSAEMLKKMRLEPESASDATAPDSRSHSTVPSKRVTTVHDEDEDEADNAESEGAAFAPGNDADYFAEEDEEGRFFGGGLTAEQKEILNIFDNAGADQVPDDVRGRACSLLFTQRQSLVFTSLKHSLLLASKSYCCG
jgi:beta-catenin-like protein 1